MTRVGVMVVEDEPLTRRALCLALAHEGFEVHEAAGVAACRAGLSDCAIDVVVLDLGLPDGDGLALGREIRRRGNLGLIVVTRRGAPEARIEALNSGADDYLIKPVHFGELAARIRSVMRRRDPIAAGQRRLGPWLVDLEARSLFRGSRSVNLTRGEFDILARLLAADGAIVTRDDLLGAISRDPLGSDLRSVDVLISRIRRKLGDDAACANLIVTAPGVGYRLSVPIEVA